MPTAQERLAAASERAVPVQVGLIDDAVVVGAAPFDVEESVADVGPWLRRPIIAREAVVLERLPATPRRGGRPGPRPEPPNRVEWFCFPEGEVVLKWRKKRPPSRCHAFALHAEGPPGLATALACVLLERPLCLHAESTTVLAPVAEALLALAAPLEWAGVYVPVLPKPLLELLDAPQAFLLGVESKWIDRGFYAERRRAEAAAGARDRERRAARGEEPVSAEDLRLPGAESGPDVTIGPGVVLFDLARRRARGEDPPALPRRRGTPSSPRRALRSRPASRRTATATATRRRAPRAPHVGLQAAEARLQLACAAAVLDLLDPGHDRAAAAAPARRGLEPKTRGVIAVARCAAAARVHAGPRRDPALPAALRGPRRPPRRRARATDAAAAAAAAEGAADADVVAAVHGPRDDRFAYRLPPPLDPDDDDDGAPPADAPPPPAPAADAPPDAAADAAAPPRLAAAALRPRRRAGAAADAPVAAATRRRRRRRRPPAAAAPRAAAPGRERARAARGPRGRRGRPSRFVAAPPVAAGSLLAAGDDGSRAARTSYEQVDIACLLRNVVASSALDTARMTAFDENNDGLVQFGEIARIFGELLRVRLLDGEIEALYDLLDNSLDHIRLVDLARFLDPRALRAAPRRAPGRLELARASTVTTVALSPDGSRVACGGMDFFCVVWDARRDLARLYRFEASGTAWGVALGASENHELSRAGGGPPVRFAVPSRDAEDAAEWPEWDSALARQQSTLRRAKTHRVLEVGASGDGEDSRLRVTDAGATYVHEDAALRVVEGESSRTRVVSVHESLDKKRLLGPGQDKRAKFPTSKAPLSAVFHSLGLDAALALGCVAAAALRGRGALSAAQYAAADLWVTFFYLLELVIRGICHVEVHHSLWKFARTRLDGGAVVGDVDRRDILTNPERRYVDMRRAAATRSWRRGFGAASGDERETRGSRGRSEAPEPLGTTPPMPRLKRFASRRWKRTRTSRAEADADPHAKGSLGERDRMPVWVRFRCASRTVETHKYVAFGGESGRAEVWRYDVAGRPRPPADGGARDAVECAAGASPRTSRHASRAWSMRFDHTVNCVSLSGSTRRVAACAREVVVVYDFDSRCVVFRLDAGDALYSVALSRSGKSVLFGGASKEVKLCDVTTAALRYEARADDRVRAVALCGDDEVLAFGGFDATLRLHHVGRGAPCAVGECGATARAVAVDRAGAVLAVGGDDALCRCYDLGRGSLSQPSWSAKHRGKVWTVSVTPDGTRVAAGDYANAVVLYAAADGAVLWLKTSWLGKGAPFTWAVHFSGDGNTLAIGHWDAYAYLVDAADLREFGAIERGDRVSRSRCHDDAVLAVGRVDCLVAVFDVASEARTATIAMEGLVQNLCFAPAARDLAIAAEQNTVDVWDLSDASRPREKLVVTRHATTNDVALSLRGFAFCNGTIFSTMGVGSRVPARVNPVSGESILQYAVRKKSRRAVDQLLHADCPIGLLGDCNGMNAITVALANERKGALSQLLDVMMTSLDGSPLAAAAFSNAHAAIADQYPDLYLDFISRSFLIHDTDVVPPGHNFALMPPTGASVTAGSDHRSPADFWSDFLVKAGARFRYFEHRESDDGAAHRPSGAFHARNSLRHMLSRRSFDGGRARRRRSPTATLGGAGVRAHLKKTEVAAMIVPFERVLGTFGGDAVSQDSVLALATRCAASMNDYRVFESQMVRAIIQFKWDHYARSIFIAQCVLCVFHFALVIALYVAVTPAMRLPTRWDPGDRGRPAHGLGEVFALALYLPVVLLTCFLLGLEVGGWLLAFFACVNVLFFNWRIISFARLRELGALVRMIVKIVWEVRFFSAVVALMLVGFWLAFAIGMQETPTEWLMVFLFNAGFYGEYEKDYLSGDQGFYDWRMDRQLPITTVLQLFMLIFGVLALNLLIAIMNSAYERVRVRRRGDAPREEHDHPLHRAPLAAHGHLRLRHPHYFFPRWLLLLGPISILDVAEEKRRAMHDRVVGMRESLS
ncbi:Rab guanyl-nucleotide exchange factor [Aureococcus anophagefferens]|nr:Rab guanyl-nucleotide exchange factor [Aureococcus anophagefferens]